MGETKNTIAEYLILPSAIDMVSTMVGESTKKPPSNFTTTQEKQLIDITSDRGVFRILSGGGYGNLLFDSERYEECIDFTMRANVSVRDDENFKKRCEKENKAFDEWPLKWEWILEEYNDRNKKLSTVKNKAMIRKGNFNMDTRTVLPFPDTTSREVGWLSSKPEFQLEIFGPDIICLPIEIKPNHKNDLPKY